MSDHSWLTDAQMAHLQPFLPKVRSAEISPRDGFPTIEQAAR
ncbi:hypothetical protein [Paracoccus simplex]|uniref:IS5/IS1182 family transposase n=1 Tax=Paracoccus simplex TaxID=2086346 RepID=A0ABV7S1C8_9RHOB